MHQQISQPPIFTKEPEDIDELEIINATSTGRQEFIIIDNSRTIINIFISKFINISHRNDGGAIYVQNAGLICNDTLFNNCSSLEGAGRAIYYLNEYNNSNLVRLIRNEVTLCEAQYEGGFYIYSNNWNNRVIVNHCTFTTNTVHAPITEGGKYGGSGIYIKSRKGKVKQNLFIENNGPGSALTINQNSDCGVFYVKGKNDHFV